MSTNFKRRQCSARHSPPRQRHRHRPHHPARFLKAVTFEAWRACVRGREEAEPRAPFNQKAYQARRARRRPELRLRLSREHAPQALIAGHPPIVGGSSARSSSQLRDLGIPCWSHRRRHREAPEASAGTASAGDGGRRDAGGALATHHQGDPCHDGPQPARGGTGFDGVLLERARDRGDGEEATVRRRYDLAWAQPLSRRVIARPARETRSPSKALRAAIGLARPHEPALAGVAPPLAILVLTRAQRSRDALRWAVGSGRRGQCPRRKRSSCAPKTDGAPRVALARRLHWPSKPCDRRRRSTSLRKASRRRLIKGLC